MRKLSFLSFYLAAILAGLFGFHLAPPLESLLHRIGVSPYAVVGVAAVGGLIGLRLTRFSPDSWIQQRSMQSIAWADWALGRSSEATVASLVAVDVPDSAARRAVDAQRAALNEGMPAEEREGARADIKLILAQIERDLANGSQQDAIVENLFRAERIDRAFASPLVSYVANGYRLFKHAASDGS